MKNYKNTINKINNWLRMLLSNSIFSMILLEFILITIGFTVGNYFEIFSISRERGFELVKETLSNYISILGIGLAILAILLSVLQFSIKRLSIVKLLIDKSQFARLFYFGSINIILCSILYLFGQDDLFIEDYYFVRGILILNCLFIVLILFIALVFTITFKYIEYSRIVSLYLQDVKKIASKEITSSNNKEYRELLQTKNQELQNEIEANNDERRLILNNKIFDLYKYVLRTNPGSLLIQNFRYNLINWLYISFKKENYLAFHNLVNNWRNIFSESVTSGDESRISILKNLPSQLYEIGIQKDDKSFKLFVIETFPIRLKEEAQVRLWRFEGETEDNTNWEAHFIEIQPILFEFNELIFSVARDKNSRLDKVLNELNMLEEYNEFDNEYRDINFKTKFQIIDGENKVVLNEKDSKTYESIDKYYIDLFALKFGNISWLYYQCFTGRSSYEELSSSITFLEQSLLKYRGEGLRFLIRLFSWGKGKYNWHEWVWRSEERLSGQTYTLENEEDILALGFIIWSLKSGIASTNIDTLSKDDIAKSEGLNHFVPRILSFFKEKKEIWYLLFNTQDPKIIDEYFINIEGFMEKLRNAKESNYLDELINEPISPEKVSDFKQMIRSQWIKSRDLSIVFEYFNSINLNPPEKLKFIGKGRINYQKAKFLFVEKLYARIYGIEWGYEIGVSLNNFFLTTLFGNSNIERVSVSKLEEGVNLAANFSLKEVKFNALFIANTALYSIERDLESSGKFKSARTEQTKKYPFEYFGVYNDSLILIPLRSNLLKENSLVAMKIPGAVQLARRTNDEWIDKELQLDVIEITDEKAREILSEQGKKEPFDEQSLKETKASILIEIGETLDFRILDTTLIKIYTLNT